MTDLFEHAGRERRAKAAPLATRMRPRTLDEYVGQEHLLGPGRVLRRAIEEDRVPSMVLWGPPGTGKTSLAFLIGDLTKSHTERLSAVTAGVADLRKVVEAARQRLDMHGQRTVLLVDEIHRFNKAQQDVILPHVEDGTVTLIGATTENPSFEVIAPLLSRCRVFVLKSLTDEQLRSLGEHALRDVGRGLGGTPAKVDENAWAFLLSMVSGDARIALNTLELAVASAPDEGGSRHVTVAVMEDVVQHRALRYDKAGELHYDTISAFIKSVRGSDPDAALYWMVRMLEAGEDPLFIVRRMVILAAEDIGLADPHALQVAVACQQAVHFIGLPEGAIPMAETVIYLASAPKSNSAYMALSAVQEDVRKTREDAVPLHLRNAVTDLMKDLGYHKGYKYGHDFDNAFAQQEYLPENLRGHRYYQPNARGSEQEAVRRLRDWWGERFKPNNDGEPTQDAR